MPNGCTFATTPAVTITEPTVLTASATKVQDVQCNGDADGSISVTASGGTAGYTYLWDDASAQTTSTATGLAPGDYTVTVTDANGCTFTTTPAVTITEPTALTASATKVQDDFSVMEMLMVARSWLQSIWRYSGLYLFMGRCFCPDYIYSDWLSTRGLYV